MFCKDLSKFLHVYAPVLILMLQMSSATHELHSPELHFCIVCSFRVWSSVLSSSSLLDFYLSRSFIFPYTYVASLCWQCFLFLHYQQIFLLYSIFIFFRPQTNSMKKRNKSSPALLHVIFCSSIQVPPKQYELSAVYIEATS